MKYFLSLFIFSFTILAHAQDTAFYDSGWKRVSSLKECEYFAFLEFNSEDYDIITELVYHKSGQINQESVFSNYEARTKEGFSRVWYPNGRLKSEIEYKEGKINGKRMTYFENGRIKRNETFVNGELMEGHIYNNEGKEVTNYEYQSAATYPGGLIEVVNFVKKETIYPKKLKKKGIEGKVVITFTVSKTGDVVNATVVKSANPKMDKEALRVINSLLKWEPAMLDGEPIPMSYNIPIDFSLTGVTVR
jgi:TonB family protein